MRVDEGQRWVDSPYCAFCYAAATCLESWHIAILDEPENKLLQVTQRVGFTNVIELVKKTPSDVLLWIVKEWNRWNTGSGWNLQQQISEIKRYDQQWSTKKKKEGWIGNFKWGTGELSHDKQMWEYLVGIHGTELIVADQTEFLRSRTWITQLERKECMPELLKVVKKFCYHQHPKYTIHEFMKVGYSIESTLRSHYSSLLTPSRMKLMLLVLHEFALPLSTNCGAKFLLHEHGDAARIERLLLMTFPFRAKAVSSLIPDASEKKKRRVTKAATAKTTEAEAQQENQLVVAENPIEDVMFGMLVSRVIDEGFWQLLVHGISPDTESECSPRVVELLTLAFMVALTEAPVEVVLPGGEKKMITDLADFREHCMNLLQDFCKGYMLVKNLVPILPPSESPPSQVAPSGDGGSTTSAGVHVQPATSEEEGLQHMADSDALKFLQFVRGTAGQFALETPTSVRRLAKISQRNLYISFMRLMYCLATFLARDLRVHAVLSSCTNFKLQTALQPTFRKIQDNLLADLPPTVADLTWRDILSSICTSVSDVIDPKWIIECAHIQRADKDHSIFFESRGDFEAFLRLRSAYITTLLGQFARAQSPDGSAAGQLLPSLVFEYLANPMNNLVVSIGDALVDDASEIEHYWSGILEWMVDPKNAGASSEVLQAFVHDLKVHLGLIVASDDEPEEPAEVESQVDAKRVANVAGSPSEATASATETQVTSADTMTDTQTETQCHASAGPESQSQAEAAVASDPIADGAGGADAGATTEPSAVVAVVAAEPEGSQRGDGDAIATVLGKQAHLCATTLANTWIRRFIMDPAAKKIVDAKSVRPWPFVKLFMLKAEQYLIECVQKEDVISNVRWSTRSAESDKLSMNYCVTTKKKHHTPKFTLAGRLTLSPSTPQSYKAAELGPISIFVDGSSVTNDHNDTNVPYEVPAIGWQVPKSVDDGEVSMKLTKNNVRIFWVDKYADWGSVLKFLGLGYNRKCNKLFARFVTLSLPHAAVNKLRIPTAYLATQSTRHPRPDEE